MKKLFSIVLAGVGLILSSCSTQMNTQGLYAAGATGLQALTLTNEQLADYVKQSVDYMDANNKVAPDNSTYTQRLNRLVGALKHVNGTDLNFKVYETNEVNAFACADGSVRVYTGIMDLMNDDELLGIIGHEIGHVAMEHSKNQFKQQLLNAALLQALGSTSNTMSALTNSELSQLASSFISAKYSRSQENEADEFGYEFIKGAGKNPYTMVQAFEKMQQLEGSSNQSAASYFQKMFSSHPETSERIARIKGFCTRDGYGPTK